MAQGWNDNTYQIDHVVSTDMINIETCLNTLKSLFSGTGAPSNAVAGMPWFDTTNKVLKIRNQANSAWLGVMYGNSSNKIWMYSNSATDGWTVDSSITDSILALKGGSAAYNVSGGNTGGTWTQPTHTHTGPSHTHTVSTHNHQWSYAYYTAGNYYNYTYNSGGTAVSIPTRNYYNTCLGITAVDSEVGYATGVNNSYTSNAGSGSTEAGGTGNTGSSSTISTWRPSAAVGTMQYPTT